MGIEEVIDYSFLADHKSLDIFINKIIDNYEYDGIDFFHKKYGRNVTIYKEYKNSKRPYIIINQNITIPKDCLIWLVANQYWQSNFIYLDGNSENASYINLLPYDFKIENAIPSISLLKSMIEYDKDENNFYWIYQNHRNNFWNSVFPCELATKIHEREKYLDLDGKIFNQKEIQKLFVDEKSYIEEEEEYLQDDAVEDEDRKSFNKFQLGEGYLDSEEKVGREKPLICFYCGDDTQITRDHVMPVSYASTSRYYDHSDTVPCCRECNGLLGNILLTTVEQRANYLADRLAIKHSKVLRAFEYSDNEIKDFGERLGSTVKDNVFFKSYIACRIDHCHRVAGSLYAPSSVSHLRGITTEARRTVYGLLEDFLNHEKSEKEFIATKAIELKEEKSLIRAIVSERSHVAVSTQLKFDRRYPLDASIRDLRRALIKLTLGKI